MKNTSHEYVADDENGRCWCCGKPRGWSAHRRRRRLVKRRWKRREFAAMMQAKEQRGKSPCKMETIWVAKHVTVLSTRAGDPVGKLAATVAEPKKGPSPWYWLLLLVAFLTGIVIVAGAGN